MDMKSKSEQKYLVLKPSEYGFVVLKVLAQLLVYQKDNRRSVWGQILFSGVTIELKGTVDRTLVL